MEKAQVTFAVTAPIGGRPLPRPIIVVTLALGSDQEKVSILRRSGEDWLVAYENEWKPGGLRADMADLAGLELSDTLYRELAWHVGFRESLRITDA